MSKTTAAANGSMYIMQNANFDTDNSFEYIVTDEASRYIQEDGRHKFYTAPSGTIGTDITFSEKMRIDESGIIHIKTDSNAGSRIITQRTTSVQDSATTIATAGTFLTYGGFYLVAGRNTADSADRFLDTLVVGLNGSITVLHSTTVRSTPYSRTYSLSAENLQLAMGTGGEDHTIQVTCFDFYTA
jgi:hypothetical protein